MQAGSARHAGYTSAVNDHAIAVDIAGQFRYQEQEQDHVQARLEAAVISAAHPK